MKESTVLNHGYTVEVSGWDDEENFFVERTKLEWNEPSVKKVMLRNRVRVGSMVFLRLLEPMSPSTNLPVAYRARQMGDEARGEYVEVDLEQLWSCEPGKTTNCGLSRLPSYALAGSAESKPAPSSPPRRQQPR
jgi:hypothetical protein